MGAILEFMFGGFLALVTLIVVVGGFMVLTGKLSIGGSRGREWKRQAEVDAKNRLKGIKFTRNEVQQYANRYYNKK
ncbi:MAG: hypothetical protein KBI20_09365 [Sedimentibacter sp.]|nr:hypothetical protein [Sedimentibacter sp.]